MSPTDGPDPLALRVSDADREQVADILREAAGAGRIDLGELDERLSTTYAARTRADLLPVTADLPAGRTAAARSLDPSPDRTLEKRPAASVHRGADRVVAGPDRATQVAIMSGVDRRGDWVVPERLTLVCFWGGADLDLREARFAAREVVITVTAIMGGAQITVDEDTEVVMEGLGVMGGFSGPSSVVPAGDDAVTVRVRGATVMGGVSVTRKPRDLPDGGRRKRLH